MKNVWDVIYQRRNGMHHYLRESWYDSWRVYNEGNNNWSHDVYYEYVNVEDQHYAIIPYSFQKMGPFNFASLAGYSMPFRGFPNTDDNEKLIKRTADAIEQIEEGDGFRMGFIRDCDPFVSKLRDELKKRKWFMVSKSYGAEYAMSVAANEEEYFATLSKNRRKNINRRRKKLETAGKVEIRNYTNETAEKWKIVFEDLAKVESKSWVVQRGDARFVGRENQTFWNDVLKDKWFSNSINVMILYFDGEPVCHYVTLDDGETRFLYDSSYDSKMAEFGVGILLDVENMKKTIKEQVKIVNENFGSNEFKATWGREETTEVFDLIFFPPTLKGAATYNIAKLKLFVDELRIKNKIDKFLRFIKIRK